MQAAE
jgi:hypothetical protein